MAVLNRNGAPAVPNRNGAPAVPNKNGAPAVSNKNDNPIEYIAKLFGEETYISFMKEMEEMGKIKMPEKNEKEKECNAKIVSYIKDKRNIRPFIAAFKQHLSGQPQFDFLEWCARLDIKDVENDVKKYYDSDINLYKYIKYKQKYFELSKSFRK